MQWSASTSVCGPRSSTLPCFGACSPQLLPKLCERSLRGGDEVLHELLACVEKGLVLAPPDACGGGVVERLVKVQRLQQAL